MAGRLDVNDIVANALVIGSCRESVGKMRMRALAAYQSLLTRPGSSGLRQCGSCTGGFPRSLG